MAYLFNHINLAYCRLGDSWTPNAFTGSHYKVILASTGSHPNWSPVPRALDFTPARAANSSLKVYLYTAFGNYMPWVGVGYSELMRDFCSWLDDNPSYSFENFFLHFQNDVNVGLWGYNHNTAEHATGLPLGWCYGHHGTATSRTQERLPGYNFGSQYSSGNKAISSISRSSNVVTVITSAAHGFYKDSRIGITGVTDASFDGFFDITSVTSTTEFKYSQTASDASSSGGNAYCKSWSLYNANFITDEFKDYLINRLTTGATREWLKDEGGNYLDGIFHDSVFNSDINNPQAYLDIEECIDGGGGGSIDAVHTWLKTVIPAWITAVKTGYTSYLSGHGITATISVNGDYTSAVGDRKETYKTKFADFVLLEQGHRPSNNDPDVLVPIYKNLIEVMDSGANLLYAGNSRADIIPSNFRGNTITWFNYSGDIWYTDAFADSKSAISCISGAYTTYYDVSNTAERYGPRFNRISTYVGLTSGQHYHDLTTGRLYANFGSGINPNVSLPSGGGTYLISGYEHFRMFSLAQFYIWGNHDYGYYGNHDFRSGSVVWEMDPDSDRAWFEAIGYDIGKPDNGGLKLDGTYGIDEWGTSTLTSSKAFEMWRRDDLLITHPTKDRLYARKYDNAYCIIRWRPNWQTEYIVGTGIKSFTFPFYFNQLRTDGTKGILTNTISLAWGEGAILITDFPEDQTVTQSFKKDSGNVITDSWDGVNEAFRIVEQNITGTISLHVHSTIMKDTGRIFQDIWDNENYAIRIVEQ